MQERKRREVRWDKQKKKFVKGTGEGADNVKLVKTESGVKLPATYRSGRFEEWKSKSRVSIPRVGESEGQGAGRSGTMGAGGRKYRHHQVTAAKPLDKLDKNFERKMRQRQKTQGEEPAPAPVGKGKKHGARFGGKPIGKVKNELKTVDQIRKARQVAEQRKAKNARAPRRGKKGKR